MNPIIKGITNNILNKRKLALAIENLVAHHNMSYLEALTFVIEETGFDPVNIKRVLDPSIKAKLKEEAMALRLITVKPAAKLPGIE
tara:strand:- start:194 stop:451 length:258 start_codon:yes stop_codon:yes gene_type:complete